MGYLINNVNHALTQKAEFMAPIHTCNSVDHRQRSRQVKIGLIQKHFPLRNGAPHPRQIDMERRYQLFRPDPIVVKSTPAPFPSACDHSNTGKVAQILEGVVCFSSRNFSPVLPLTHDTMSNPFPLLVQTNPDLPTPTQLSPGVLSVSNNFHLNPFPV